MAHAWRTRSPSHSSPRKATARFPLYNTNFVLLLPFLCSNCCLFLSAKPVSACAETVFYVQTLQGMRLIAGWHSPTKGNRAAEEGNGSSLPSPSPTILSQFDLSLLSPPTSSWPHTRHLSFPVLQQRNSSDFFNVSFKVPPTASVPELVTHCLSPSPFSSGVRATSTCFSSPPSKSGHRAGRKGTRRLNICLPRPTRISCRGGWCQTAGHPRWGVLLRPFIHPTTVRCQVTTSPPLRQPPRRQNSVLIQPRRT